MVEEIELGVSDFIAVLNQTLEFAYPSVTVIGELANFRIWQNRLVFFDLKDEESLMKCFAFVTQLPGPLEDGMTLKVKGRPQHHKTNGFSFNVHYLQPAGEGAIKKAADLLQAKLAAEGLFDPARKRSLPYPPQRIGLLTSAQSAAYADFVKILNARWSGLDIELIDVQVQGESAPAQIVSALEQLNELAEPPEVIVLIRGGGSAEDLAAFSAENVTRAVAASRVPTLVAIGHEVDLSLAELAADVRASTPSNAAELLVPDRAHELKRLHDSAKQLGQALSQSVADARRETVQTAQSLAEAIDDFLLNKQRDLVIKKQLLGVFNPNEVLKRGYAIIRAEKGLVTSVKGLKTGQNAKLELQDGSAGISITSINPKK